MNQLFSVLDEDFILAVEGSVSMKDGGIYTVVGMRDGELLTAYDAVRLLGERASHVIAVGACASDGGVSAASPNPSESVSVQRVVSKRVIRLPGCPCNPRWFLTTLAYILLFGDPELDELNRPRIVYNALIHDQCPRRSVLGQRYFRDPPGGAYLHVSPGLQRPDHADGLSDRKMESAHQLAGAG